MYPATPAQLHPAGSMLLQYAKEGCPVDAGGEWTPDEITAAVNRGPHVSSLHADAIAYMQEEVQMKKQQGFVEVVVALTEGRSMPNTLSSKERLRMAR